MTRAQMFNVLDPEDILDAMLPCELANELKSSVINFFNYLYGPKKTKLSKGVKNTILVWALLNAKNFKNFIVYLRQCAETFITKYHITEVSHALEFFKTNRDNMNKQDNLNRIVETPDWFDRYLKELEEME